MISITKTTRFFFDALQKLIYEKNRPVQVMLVGDGPSRAYLTQLVNDMALKNYVHFLGWTPKTMDVVHHSDMHVSCSNSAFWGAQNFEAAFHEKKHLLELRELGLNLLLPTKPPVFFFQNNNIEDLTTQLERLIDNHQLTKQLGEQAFVHTMNNFSQDAQFATLEKLFDAVMKK